MLKLRATREKLQRAAFEHAGIHEPAGRWRYARQRIKAPCQSAGVVPRLFAERSADRYLNQFQERALKPSGRRVLSPLSPV